MEKELKSLKALVRIHYRQTIRGLMIGTNSLSTGKTGQARKEAGQ
jgi:hypothetical protein